MVYPILNGAIIDLRIQYGIVYFNVFYILHFVFVYPTNLHLVLGYNSSFYMSVVYTYIYTLYTYDCLKIRQFLDSLHCSDALGLGISTYLHLSAKKRKRSLQRTRGNNPHNQPEMEIMQDLWICEV